MNIADNLSIISKQIRDAEKSYQRSENSVQLIAVSKKKPVSDILAAANAGQCHFGENYCQEAVDKILEIKRHDLIWHFIGPVQSNKTKLIAEHFHWVHTVDRLKIARRLNAARSPDVAPLNICIQINISGESSKSGIHPEQAPEFLQALAELENLKVRGLMSLPAPETDFNAQRKAFAKLRHCLESLQQINSSLDTLSIGTSQDMVAAIAEGSSMVRIGTAIFGKRDAS